MADNKIVNNPSFTDDEGVETQTGTQDQGVEEKETPAESPDVKTPQDETPAENDKEIEGLKNQLEKLNNQNSYEAERLRQDIVDARKRKREIKQQRRGLETLPEDDDDLSDLDDETKTTVERIVKAKGFVRADDVAKNALETAHKQAESEFFRSHPEYSPETDENDTLFEALQEELQNFVQPKDPLQITQLFEKAHRLVQDRYPSRFSNPTKTPARADVAALSGGQSQGASSTPKQGKLNEKQISHLRANGWSEEDIKKLNEG